MYREGSSDPMVWYVSMGLRQEEDIIQPMERMTSSGDRHQDCRVQVQVENHEEIKFLKLAIHVVSMDL